MKTFELVHVPDRSLESQRVRRRASLVQVRVLVEKEVNNSAFGCCLCVHRGVASSPSALLNKAAWQAARR